MSGSPDADSYEVNTLDSEVKLRKFTPHPYQSLNEAGEILTVNDAWLDVLGYERTDVEGEWFGTFLTVSSTERFKSQFPRFKDEGDISDVEFEMVHADGVTISVAFDGTIQFDADSNFVRTHCQFNDITERKRREQELAEEREKYETLVTNSHDAIGLVQDKKYVFANPQAKEILGYDPSELLGKPFDEIVVPEERDLLRNRYERRLDSDAESPPAQYDAHIHTADGERRSVEVSAARIRYEGKPADLITFRDVTKREQYEQELEHKTEELEALNRLVRHDIRNDMTVVLGRAELLEEYIQPGGSEHLQRIQENSEHVVELTDIARDLVETLNSDDTTDSEPTSVRSVLRTELNLAQESYPDAEFVTASEIPAVKVRANELLGSVFRNILNNAVQHTNKDTPVVEVNCDVGEDDIEVRIADNGPGIPDGQKESVFGKGEKGLGSSGTGIGLYLVQRLIDQYDGRVWIEDNEPDGAVFILKLPKAN